MTEDKASRHSQEGGGRAEFHPDVPFRAKTGRRRMGSVRRKFAPVTFRILGTIYNMEDQNQPGNDAVAQACATLACDQCGATSGLRSAKRFRNAADVLRHKSIAHPRYEAGGEPLTRFRGVRERLRVGEKLRVLEADRWRLGLRVGLEDNSPIALLPLPSRLIHALYCAGVETLGDLNGFSEDEIRRWRNIGQTSVDHLRKFLALAGRALQPAAPTVPRRK